MIVKDVLDQIKCKTMKTAPCTLAGVAQWTEHWPANQKVTGWIPSQGTSLGCGPGPQWSHTEATTH